MSKHPEFTHKDLPVYSFVNDANFEKWLSKNYTRDAGFWLHIYKKATNIPSVQLGQAVEVALCYGWIDGLLNTYDAKSYLVRFTQRRPRSVWSKVNVARVEKLVAEGRMQPSGQAAVDAAKLDGRWDAAYSSKKQS